MKSTTRVLFGLLLLIALLAAGANMFPQDLVKVYKLSPEETAALKAAYADSQAKQRAAQEAKDKFDAIREKAIALRMSKTKCHRCTEVTYDYALYWSLSDDFTALIPRQAGTVDYFDFPYARYASSPTKTGCSSNACVGLDH